MPENKTALPSGRAVPLLSAQYVVNLLRLLKHVINSRFDIIVT